MSEVYNISMFKKLEILSLLDNPVSLASNYRYYVISKIPTIKLLDFVKVSQTERSEADQWAKSKEGRAYLAQIQADAMTSNASSAAVDQSGTLQSVVVPSVALASVKKVDKVVPKRIFTDLEKKQLKAAIEMATTPEQMDLIERQLKVSVCTCDFICMSF